MEYCRTLLKQNDGIDRFDILVTELLFLFVPDSLVLAKQQIRRVAGCPLSRKQIAYLLYLYIGKAAVRQLLKRFNKF